MTIIEAIRRLKVEPNDEEAVKEVLGNYDKFIDYQTRKFKNNIVGMDEGDMKQEIYLQILKRITDIDLRLDPHEVDSYIKRLISNKLIRMTRESKRELYTTESIDKQKHTYDDGDEVSFEQTLHDVNDNLVKNFEDTYLVEELKSKVSPKAQKIIDIIVESEGSTKKIKEALNEYPEFSSSKGVINRLLENEIKPVLEKLIAVK